MKLWFAALFGLSAACGPSAEPCTTPGVCGEGRECLANRCVRIGSDPVRLDSERFVLRPTSLRVLSDGRAETPSSVTFGSWRGSSALYLHFEPAIAQRHTIDAAFLLLDPMPAPLASTEAVELHAWRIAQPWPRSRQMTAAAPELDPPHSRAFAHPGSSATLRVDVTSIVKVLAADPHHDFGLALVASQGRGHGASYTTGLSLGQGPRLEVYVARSRKR
jgi:hypothetical protein